MKILADRKSVLFFVCIVTAQTLFPMNPKAKPTDLINIGLDAMRISLASISKQERTNRPVTSIKELLKYAPKGKNAAINTAHIYGKKPDDAERLVGKALLQLSPKEHAKLVVTTFVDICGMQTPTETNEHDLIRPDEDYYPKKAHTQFEKSLQFLKMHECKEVELCVGLHRVNTHKNLELPIRELKRVAASPRVSNVGPSEVSIHVLEKFKNARLQVNFLETEMSIVQQFMVTDVAEETYLVTKAAKGVRNTCRRARNSMRQIRTEAKNIEFSELPATVFATPEDIEVEFACKGLELAGSEMLPVLETLYRHSPELGKYVIKLETLFLELDELFSTLKHTFGEYKNVTLKGRARHIFGIELIEKKMADGAIKLRISGFHHDYLGFLENNGLITLAEKKLYSNGVYEAKLIINGVPLKPKTFFPKSWPPEKVIEKITESMKNLTAKPEIQGNRAVLIGLTSGEVEIKTVVDLVTKKIVTSRPIL